MSTEEYITANWLKMSDGVIAKNTGLPYTVIESKRRALGLRKKESQYLKRISHPLAKKAKCYKMWINGMSIVDISKAAKMSQPYVSLVINMFMPYRGLESKTITLKSKV